MSQPTVPIRPTPPPPRAGSARLLWIALALGVVAMAANLIYIQMVRSQTSQQVFDVYQFTRPIKAGRTISRDDLKAIELPESVRASFDAIGVVPRENLANRLGREPLQEDVAQGQLLTYALFQHNPNRRLDDRIAHDKRWVSLPINSRTVPGALRVGMYVDIEAPFNLGGAFPQILPVLERVQIQALGLTTLEDAMDDGRPVRSFQTITIEVSPLEATQLATLQRLAVGDFELQPRNPNDEKRVKIPQGGINPAVLNYMARITRDNPPPTSRSR